MEHCLWRRLRLVPDGRVTAGKRGWLRRHRRTRQNHRLPDEVGAHLADTAAESRPLHLHHVTSSSLPWRRPASLATASPRDSDSRWSIARVSSTQLVILTTWRPYETIPTACLMSGVSRSFKQSTTTIRTQKWHIWQMKLTVLKKYISWRFRITATIHMKNSKLCRCKISC